MHLAVALAQRAGEQRPEYGSIEPVMAKLAVAREQHRDLVAPARVKLAIAVDVDHLKRCPVFAQQRNERFAHLVAKVAVTANE